MMIHDITEKVGKHKARRRVGRGRGSGVGKTSGRGHKGAASRAGFSRRPYFEGGQMSFVRRMPKRGFSNVQFRTNYHVVNLKTLQERVEDGATVDAKSLAAAGIIRDAKLPLKILGEGELTKKLTITAARYSEAAKAKIEKAGGTANEEPLMKWTRQGVVPAGGKPKKKAEAQAPVKEVKSKKQKGKKKDSPESAAEAKSEAEG
jgi:large subunit ribosomal protein L15